MGRRHVHQITAEHRRMLSQHGAGLAVYHGAQGGAGLFSSLLGAGRSLVTAAMPHLLPGLKSAAGQAISAGSTALGNAVQSSLDKAGAKRARPF